MNDPLTKEDLDLLITANKNKELFSAPDICLNSKELTDSITALVKELFR